MNIQGNSFIVTGGASGLGGACTRLLAAAGANVLIADLNEATGAALAAELGEHVLFQKTDVADEASATAAVNRALSAFGSIQGSIQCAGIGHAEKMLGKSGPHTLATFQRVLAINLTGVFNMMRLTAAAMEKNAPTPSGERGVLINTSSVSAFEGQIGQVAYSASKGAVASMTLPAARELARSGIRVVAIAPGIFDTPLLAGLPEPARVSLGQQVPFPQRLGRPEEFAALVRQIIENEMLNGCTLRLDGALRMAPK